MFNPACALPNKPEGRQAARLRLFRQVHWVVFLLLIGASVLLAVQARADGMQREEGRLALTVTGSATAVPDMASLSAGVVSEGETAAQAMASQRMAMAGVFTAMKEAGIAEKDIQTGQFGLSPVWVHDPKRQEAPHISGYRVTNRLTVIVRDLTGIGAALDAFVAAGANDIGQVSFGFSDMTAMEKKARADAVATLLARRDFYAEAAGIKVGRLISLSEQGGGRSPAPKAMMMRAEAVASAPTPVAAGESSVEIVLHAVYAIDE